jgi:hypothetical protein
VEPQRNVPGDGEHRWFEGGEWDRGRHGAPGPGGSYQGAEEEYTGAFNEPSSAPPATAPEPAETSRRSTEAIDVAALRQPSATSPPPAGGWPPVASPPAEYPPPPAYPPAAAPAPAAYTPPEQPLYPASPPAGGNPGFGGPTASVHTIAPAHHQQPGPGPSIYQSRKPVVLIALVALTVLFEIPALRLLASATLADAVPASGVVAGTFLVLGIPVSAYGLYGMLGGGPVTGNLSVWLKQPLIYLPLGVLLFLFAALAA